MVRLLLHGVPIKQAQSIQSSRVRLSAMSSRSNADTWRIRQRIHDLCNEFDLDRRERIERRLEFIKRHGALNLRSIRSTKAGLISIPTQLRPSSLAAIRVVPEPAYGSSTILSSRVVMATQHRASERGIIAG